MSITVLATCTGGTPHAVLERTSACQKVAGPHHIDLAVTDSNVPFPHAIVSAARKLEKEQARGRVSMPTESHSLNPFGRSQPYRVVALRAEFADFFLAVSLRLTHFVTIPCPPARVTKRHAGFLQLLKPRRLLLGETGLSHSPCSWVMPSDLQRSYATLVLASIAAEPAALTNTEPK